MAWRQELKKTQRGGNKPRTPSVYPVLDAEWSAVSPRWNAAARGLEIWAGSRRVFYNGRDLR